MSCPNRLTSLDDDPNGEYNACCAQCRAEEAHDFDAEPDVIFERDGTEKVVPSHNKEFLQKALDLLRLVPNMKGKDEVLKGLEGLLNA